MSEQNVFKMIDVGEKIPSWRRAVAKGRITMAPATVERIRHRQMPKGDVLALAEVAGIMAAKNTAQILPLCHPLLIESVRINTECLEDFIQVSCEVIMMGKTGVEMEALCGVNAALLCIYDLTKGIDPVLSLSQIYLDLKEGGRSGRWTHPAHSGENVSVKGTENKLEGVDAAVITISDRTSRGESVNVSGPTLLRELESRGAHVRSTKLVSDEINEIQKAVLQCKEAGAQLIITTGGTGLGPRDVTPEAMRGLWTKTIPGFGEILRSRGAIYTEKSYLSRSEAGLIGETLVVLLPGSPKACKEAIEILEKILQHGLQIARGKNHG